MEEAAKFSSGLSFLKVDFVWWGLALSVLWLVVEFWSLRLRRRSLGAFAQVLISGRFYSTWKTFLRIGARVLIIFLLFLALARPIMGFRSEKVMSRGSKLLVLLDVSKSMFAPDAVPNRFERARYALLDMLDGLNGVAIGLLPFSGTSFLLCPITNDYDTFSSSLKAIEPGYLPVSGTNLAGAIDEAAKAFGEDKLGSKIILLISDGENYDSRLEAALKRAKTKELRIFTVGVGTEAGDYLPMPEDLGGGFVRDESGNYVKSSLKEDVLKNIANAASGKYMRLSAGKSLLAFYKKHIDANDKGETQSSLRYQPIERYQWPLFFAFGLILCEFLSSDKRRSGGKRGESGVLNF